MVTVGELALEGTGEREEPFSHFISAEPVTSAKSLGLHGAVDDKGCARQGLERGADIAIGVEIMRPRGAAASR